MHNSPMTRPIRVLLAKPGLDGHDRGIKIIARDLRDAGMEVIYSGIRKTPEMIVRAALDEDVDALGLSSLSGAHLPHFPRVAELLQAERGGEILLFCGGIIPEEDFDTLKKAGYKGIFGPGATSGDIVSFIRENVET